MNYRVVSITNNVGEYPESAKDTENFPHLVQHLEDEHELFVVRLGTDDFWCADDFLQMVGIRDFSTDEEYNF